MTNGPGNRPTYDQWSSILDEGSFEEVYDALETVVAHLEDAHLPLADALACYELGMRLAARCDRYLQEAELRISRLDEDTARAAADDDPLADDFEQSRL
ncbi:MAG: exodeoxyribonuclease VII small subunit [Chloroflexia bacterium]|nr:exodeoxyribonuclease VII small subunit [Chloroflexia bacterium]